METADVDIRHAEEKERKGEKPNILCILYVYSTDSFTLVSLLS